MQAPDHSMTKRTTDLLWPLGVGMLTGWVCLFLFLAQILIHGVKKQSWHRIILVIVAFVGIWISIRLQKSEA